MTKKLDAVAENNKRIARKMIASGIKTHPAAITVNGDIWTVNIGGYPGHTLVTFKRQPFGDSKFPQYRFVYVGEEYVPREQPAPAPVEVKPAPEAPTAIVWRELDTIGAEVYLKSKSAQRAREMYYSHPAADSAEFEVKPATTSPALVETGERVIALPTVATSEVESASKRLSEATSAYWNHYRQMETKRGNGRYAKNTALLMRDTETLYNLSKQLGRAATAYAQMVSLTNAGGAE